MRGCNVLKEGKKKGKRIEEGNGCKKERKKSKEEGMSSQLRSVRRRRLGRHLKRKKKEKNMKRKRQSLKKSRGRREKRNVKLKIG